MLVWLAVTANAQDPAEEVVVTGQRLDAARTELVEALHERGYFRLIRVGDRSYWFTPRPWKPWVMVHAEGFARYHSVRLYPVGPARPMPGGSGVAEAGATFVTQSTRQVRSQREHLAEGIEPYLATVRDAEWAVASAQQRAALRDQLVRLWFDPGTPAQARRDAIVARWLHTEPDRDGQRVRDQIGEFVDTEVQPSDHPFTADEVEAANRARTFDDRFEPAPPR